MVGWQHRWFACLVFVNVCVFVSVCVCVCMCVSVCFVFCLLGMYLDHVPPPPPPPPPPLLQPTMCSPRFTCCISMCSDAIRFAMTQAMARKQGYAVSVFKRKENCPSVSSQAEHSCVSGPTLHTVFLLQEHTPTVLLACLSVCLCLTHPLNGRHSAVRSI